MNRRRLPHKVRGGTRHEAEAAEATHRFGLDMSRPEFELTTAKMSFALKVRVRARGPRARLPLRVRREGTLEGTLASPACAFVPLVR